MIFQGREGRGGRIPALISPTGGRRARGGGRNNLRQSPYFRENTDGSWNYDLPAKLIIKNLDFAVTAKDVHELFSDHPNDHRQKIRLIRFFKMATKVYSFLKQSWHDNYLTQFVVGFS